MPPSPIISVTSISTDGFNVPMDRVKANVTAIIVIANITNLKWVFNKSRFMCVTKDKNPNAWGQFYYSNLFKCRVKLAHKIYKNMKFTNWIGFIAGC